MYNYYRGKGSYTPAIKRAIIESELIDAYHWLPQDIKKIPYIDLQKFYIIRRQKSQTLEEKQVMAMESKAEKAKAKPSLNAQSKRKRK